jgi:hypothetical protein
MLWLFRSKDTVTGVSILDQSQQLDDTPETWAELLDNPDVVTDKAGKEAAYVLTGARYFSTAEDRTKENVDVVETLVLDVDGVSVPEADLLAALAGTRAIVYASPSHTTASPRWRVLLPLLTPLPPKKHRALVQALSDGLVPGYPGCIDVAHTGDPCRLGFVHVTLHPEDYCWHSLTGTRFDWTGLDLADEAGRPAGPLAGLTRSPLWSDRQTALRAALKRYGETGVGLGPGQGRTMTLWETSMALWWDWAAEDETFVRAVLDQVNSNFAVPEDSDTVERKMREAHGRTIGDQRIGQRRGTYGIAREPANVITRQAITDYARKLKRRAKGDSSVVGEALMRLAKGETLSDDVEAWRGLATKCAYELARAFPHERPERLADHFRPALATMKHAGSAAIPSEDDILAYVTTRLDSQRRSKEEHEQRREHDAEKQIELATNGARSKPYTKQEVSTWKSTTGLEDNNWIVVSGAAFYVFCDGTWNGPYNEMEFEASGRRDLAAAEQGGFVYLSKVTEDAVKAVPLKTLVQKYGRQAATRIEMWCERAYFSVDDNTLVLAGPSRNLIKPKYDEQVDVWLRTMTGRDANANKREAEKRTSDDDFDTLCDWLASVIETQHPLAALYLQGEKDHGKGLFASGVARIWRSGAIGIEDAFHKSGFNSLLAESPLVWVDEAFPDQMKPSDILRRGLAQREHTFTRKHRDSGKLHGCVRVLITANNSDVIGRNERLTKEDHDAVATRYAHIIVRQAAYTYLQSIGPRGRASFVDDSRIAGHTLWLHEQRFAALHKRGARFLVETNNARIANLMVTSKPEATALLTALVHSVVENRKADWYLASGNTLWVNSVDAVAQARLIDPSLRVTEATMIRSLRAMSTGRRQTQRVKNKQLKKMWELHPDVLESWCDATNIVDYDDVVEAIKAAEVAAAVAAAAEAKGQQNGRAD